MNLAKQKAIVAFIGLFFSINAISYSQTEKQIVENYRKALQRAVDSDYVQSMELKGEFIIKNVNFPITIFFKLPNLFRMEMEFQSVTFIQLSNDTVKWEYNPFEDKSTITRLSKTESKEYKKSSTFDFVSHELLNYKEWNHSVKYKGKEKMDSLEVYVLELTNKSRKETHAKFYINVKNNLLYKVEDESGFRYFANYTDVNGYVFPKYLYDYKPDETLEAHFTKCIINKTIADSLFIIPQNTLDNKKLSEETGNKELAHADSIYGLGNMEEAEALYTKYIKQNSKSYRAYNARGLVKIGQKEYYDAIVDFNRAIEIEPTGIAARNNLGLAKYYLGDLTGAIKDYTRALALEPTYVTSLKNRGYSYLQLKDYEKAISDFQAVTKLRFEDGEAHFKCGIALAQLERFDEALASYGLAINNKYQTAEVYNYKGVTEYKTGRYDSARISFGKAVRMNADHLQYIENYGRTFYELGEYDKAIQQFENYLKKKNDQPEIHNLIGLCRYKEENYKSAIKNFSKSIELDGKNAAYYDNRAAAKEMIEDYEGAIVDYGESIRVYPNDASVFYKRGLIKLYTSRKLEGCLDLGTAHEMKYEPAKDAIFRNCN